MVKRYNPTAKIQSSMAPYEEEAVVVIEQCPDGEFVKHEAYRSLEAKYNKLVYGKTCYNISKRTNLSCQEVQKRVVNFYQNYQEYQDNNKQFEHCPMEMEISDGFFIESNAIMKIVKNSEEQSEQ